VCVVSRVRGGAGLGVRRMCGDRVRTGAGIVRVVSTVGGWGGRAGREAHVYG
jgi:hypothetical protein